jgi:plastocyanin
MKTALSTALSVAALVAISLSSACGGGDGGSGPPPVTVASVVITSPAGPTSFQTLGRTRQFAAQPKDASGANMTATVTWASSNAAVATVSGSGLVTAAANGTAGITATAGGQVSSQLMVTVTQVPAAITGLPATVAFGALGSTKQLTGTIADSGGSTVAGAGTPAFTRAGAGTNATVTAGGLVTSTGVGIGDTVVVTSGSLVVRAPIVVTQVVATVAVTSTSGTPDTLFTSTRTRQFSATARDSNNNLIAAATFAWTSSVTGVAIVGPASGLVTAGTTDGSTNIQAGSGGVNGVRAMVLRRYPATFTISPASASITTNAGFQLFTGTSFDSVNAAIPISWASLNGTVVTVSPTTGTSTTATAVTNGSTSVVMTSQARSVSAAVIASNQTGVVNATVSVGDFFFKSSRNNSQPAVDTVTVGGTVAWNWVGVNLHSVEYLSGTPAFTSSTIKSSGSYFIVFNTAGTYTYDCAVHGVLMTGIVVVR